MNRCCCNRMRYSHGMVHGPAVYNMGNVGINNIFSYNNGFNFQSLILLILILLQFGRRGNYESNSGNIVDNSILFIIVLFFLVCGCGRGFGGQCGYMR